MLPPDLETSRVEFRVGDRGVDYICQVSYAGEAACQFSSDACENRADMHALFEGLFDDAALYPPAELPMREALRGHAEHCSAWYRDLVGPFVCGARRLEELQGTLHEPISVALLAPENGVAEAVAFVGHDPRLRLTAVEVASNDVDAVVRAFEECLPHSVAGYVEAPLRQVPRLEGTRYRAKIRLGGATHLAFPRQADVAAFIRECARLGVAFKATAGLHHALRHTDPRTGFEHHGFLNLLLAAHEPDDAERWLGERDARVVVAAIEPLLGSERVAPVSIGTCSIAEPVDDLIALGLLAKP